MTTGTNVIAAYDTISTDSHNPVDLAAALIPWLRRIPDTHYAQPYINSMESVIEAGDPDGETEDIQEAFDLLQDYAPPYTSVGAHPGDGAHFGCWPVDPNEIDDIPRVSDLDELEPGYIGEAFVVNERGNCTLYSVTGWTPETGEIWSMV